MDTLNNFRKNMKDRREASGITLKEIAEQIGVKEATVQRYESGNGIKSIPYDKIIAISNVLKCSPAYLMGWEEEKIMDTISSDNAVIGAKVAKNPDLQKLVLYYEASDNIGKKRIIENAQDMAKLYPKEEEHG